LSPPRIVAAAVAEAKAVASEEEKGQGKPTPAVAEAKAVASEEEKGPGKPTQEWHHKLQEVCLRRCRPPTSERSPR